MKMIVVLALAAMAMAEPEADPALLYRSWGYPYSYGLRTYGVHAPLAYHGYPYTTYYGKRSADAEPEAEADPAVLLSSSYVHSSPLLRTVVPATYTAPVVQRVVPTVAAAPVVQKTVVSSPAVVRYNTVPVAHHAPVLSYSSALPLAYNTLTHPVTSVNNVPVVHTVAKREAEAEAEPEADPALLYTTSAVHAPLTYTHHAVAAPVTYTHAVATPVVKTVAATPAVQTVAAPVTYTHHVAQPVTYTTHAVAAPVAKAVSPVVQYVAANAVPIAKNMDHGVAATTAGLVHSSHVGVCLNNMGVQVPC